MISFTFQQSSSSNHELGVGQFVEIPALNLPSQNPTTSEPMHIEHHYDQLRNDPSNPYVIIEKLREELKKVKAASAKKSKRIRKLMSCIHEMKKGKVPKVTEEIICHKKLNHKYSEAQIDEMISKSPRQRSKKWNTSNYGSAFNLLCKVGKKGYQFVRKNLLFQPGLSTLQTKFNFLAFRPGFIRHIFTYVQAHLVHTDSWKNGHGKIAVFCFDEVSVAKLALYFPKFDCILGEQTF